MENIKGVIFDLDGVLVFTDLFHFQAWKTIADRIGADFTQRDNDRLRGVSRMESLEIVLEKYAGPPLAYEEKLALAAEKNSLYRRLLSQMSSDDVTDEVRDTLRALRERGLRLAVGSSSKNARYILERTGLTDYFDAVSDGTNITKSKPDPEVFLKAAEFLGLAPSDCLVVEDAYAGIEAAKAGNMTAAAIGAAVTSPLADIRLDCLSRLLDVV